MDQTSLNTFITLGWYLGENGSYFMEKSFSDFAVDVFQLLCVKPLMTWSFLTKRWLYLLLK